MENKELDGDKYGIVCITCLEPATENISGEWFCVLHAPDQGPGSSERDEELQAEIDEDARLSDIEAEIAASGEDPYPARRMGRPPYDDQEPKEREQVMLEPSITRQVEQLAREQGMTKSAALRQLVMQALEAKPKP